MAVKSDSIWHYPSGFFRSLFCILLVQITISPIIVIAKSWAFQASE